MSSDFKKLNIDRSLLKSSVQSYWDGNSCRQCEYVELSSSKHRVTYVENDCTVMVDLLFIKDGTTTLNTKVGKHQDVGENLATYLKDELVSDARQSVNFSIKNIDQEIFTALLTFLEELNVEDSELATVSVIDCAEDTTKKSVKVDTQYKDSLSLTHYRTRNKLLIQGKPLYAYAQVSYFLSEYTDLDGFLDIVYKGEAKPDSVNVNADAIETELRDLLPSAYDQLEEGILKLIRTSYILKEAAIELPDYSSHVFPVLRALEGVMKSLLGRKGIRIGKKGFGEVFYPRRGLPYQVNNEYSIRIDSTNVCRALSICYNHYHSQRHRLFHMDDVIEMSKFIQTQHEAAGYIDKTIGTIEQAYSTIT